MNAVNLSYVGRDMIPENYRREFLGLVLVLLFSFSDTSAQTELTPLVTSAGKVVSAPLWAFSFGNTSRPKEGGWEGASGPTSVQTHVPNAYNTGMNYIFGTPKFMDVDEINFSVSYQHRILSAESRYSLSIFGFKEKLNYDQYHFNNEAPFHINLGATANSNYWVYASAYKIYGSMTGGAGGIFGAPRFETNPQRPDTNNPGQFLPYGQVIHHGPYLAIPPYIKDAPRFWLTGITETVIAKVQVTLGLNMLFYVGGRITVSEFFQQATTIGTLPRKTKLSLGGEYGLAFCIP
jgi:hypothetical protein